MATAPVTMAADDGSAPAPGTSLTRFNAVKHGIRSRHTVLPWEDSGAYDALLEALAAEHRPRGPTEEHLVEELAGVLWRTRRLRLAEAAMLRQSLSATTKSYSGTGAAALVLAGGITHDGSVAEALRTGPEDDARHHAEIDLDAAMTARTLRRLRAGGAYDEAVAALHEDTAEGWRAQLAWEAEEYEDGEEPYSPDAGSLKRFLETEAPADFAASRRALEGRRLIRAQAFGDACDPARLEPLARYETHLDRKLERTLAILVKLQQLRREAGDAKPD